jgi:hypothetical protein
MTDQEIIDQLRYNRGMRDAQSGKSPGESWEPYVRGYNEAYEKVEHFECSNCGSNDVQVTFSKIKCYECSSVNYK